MMIYAAAVIAGLMCTVLTSWAAHAEGLPGGITCAQVVQYAGDLNIPDTRWGRARARIIAATFGLYLTTAQLNAAASCLRQYRANHEAQAR